jgi:hypothetical protein
MSVPNDFFLATDDELAAVETRNGPGQSLAVVDGKGVLDVELATLERILHRESIDDVEGVVDLIEDPVRQEPESDPEAWISPVSDRLVAALAAADGKHLRSAADEWVVTEEMAAGGWSRDEARSERAAAGLPLGLAAGQALLRRASSISMRVPNPLAPFAA